MSSLFARALQPVVNAAWRLTHSPQQQTGNGRTDQRRRSSVRSFSAGNIDRLTQDWIASPETADQVVFKQLRTLRARSRDQAFANDYVRRFLALLVSNVIGENGMRLQSQVVDTTGNADGPARTAIEKTWLEWQKNTHSDFFHKLHFTDQLALIIKTAAIDGEVFIRERTDGKHALKIELIDAEMVDIGLNEQRPNGNRIVFGIEYDNANRAVAYYVLTNSRATSTWLSQSNSKRYTRISAKEITHLFITDRLGQRRGLPWIATPLARLKMLGAMEEAALIAARIGASKMGFFKSKDGEEYEGEEDATGTPVMDISPGTFENIGSLDFQTFDPDYPKGEFAVYVKSILRGISAGLSVSYNTLANDLEGVNFSSMRHGVMEDREGWKAIQGWLVRSWLDGLFGRWIEAQYVLQNIIIPSRRGGPRPLSRELAYYEPARFQPRRWAWVDILKEIQAKKEEVLLGVTSISRIIREMGEDPDELFKEIAAEREQLEALGILPGILKALETEVSTIDTEEDDDEKTGTDDNGTDKTHKSAE